MRACEDLFGRSEAIQQFLADFAEKNKEAATGFTAAVKKVLAKIKAFFENLMFGHSSRTLEAGIVRKCGTDVVDGLQEQYDKTFMAALDGNAARNAMGEFEQAGVRFSSNDSAEDDSIKEQLKKHFKTLDEMEPVSDVSYAVTNKGKARKDASEVFKKAGYRVDRQGFGIIEIGEKQLTESSNYLNTPAEFAAWMSIPKVLKRGVVISGHRDHKQRGFPSTTIAAPVVINGKRGNVAVVVQQKGKNKYHVHRILMPDGSKFVYENIQQNAEPTGDSIARKNPHKGLSISSASNNSIPQNDEKSTPDAKKLLENRVSGDDLLNAQDLIADVQELGGQVDEYGYITLYHRTSADKAAAIRSTGEMVAKEDGLFFSTKIDGQNIGYGDTVVTFSIPAEKLLLDDIFDDEAHLRFPLKKPGRVSVKEYLVGEDTGDTGLHSDPEDDMTPKITVGMSDADRAAILQKRRIVASVYEGQADAIIAEKKAELDRERKEFGKSAVVEIAKKLEIIDSEIDFKDVDVKITLSKSNIKESITKEATPEQIVKLLPILASTAKESVVIERHDNRYYYDIDTVYFDNLLGAYIDDDVLVPVRFGLKHSKTGSTTLYVVVDQNQIELKDLQEIKNDRDHKDASSDSTESDSLLSSVTYSIAQIVPFVNSKDLLRYLPDDMLNTEQKIRRMRSCNLTVKSSAKAIIKKEPPRRFFFDDQGFQCSAKTSFAICT